MSPWLYSQHDPSLGNHPHYACIKMLLLYLMKDRLLRHGSFVPCRSSRYFCRAVKAHETNSPGYGRHKCCRGLRLDR